MTVIVQQFNMATGGEPPVEDSDVFYDFACSVCNKNGKNVEAFKSCQECAQNMCEECLANHNMFKAMRKHTLLEKDEVDQTKQTTPVAPTLKCARHHGNKIELYCDKHDVVGCSTCISISHRLCGDMHYIPDATADAKKKHPNEQKTVEDSMDNLIIKAKRIKLDRERTLENMVTKRDGAKEHINRRVNAVQEQLEDVKNKAFAEIDETYQEREKAVTLDISQSNDVLSTLSREEKRRKASQEYNESDVFIYLKQGQVVLKESGKLIEGLERSGVAFASHSYETAVDDIVLASTHSLEALKSSKSVASLSLEQKVKVRISGDQSICSISGCCFLDNGNMFLTDEGNSCVKLFDLSYRKVDRCQLPDIPSAVCSIGSREVAIVLFNDRCVQFATVDKKIRLTQSFTVRGNCRGIAYSENKLYICGGGKSSEKEGPGRVMIFSVNGDLLQTIMPSGPMQHTFSIPANLATSIKGQCFVANNRKGIIAFDKNGQVMWQFQNSDLKQAVGVCEIDNDTVLVNCLLSGNVFEIKQTDKTLRILHHGTNELLDSQSLTYNSKNDKLTITNLKGDHIFVYKVNRI